MASRNHNLNKKQKRKTVSKNNGIREEKEGRMYGNVIAIVISGLALLVSSLSLAATIYYSNKEYRYKLEPEITADTEIGVQAYHTGDNIRSFDVYSDGITIRVLAKNNLSKAYLIHPDFTVKELEIDDVENVLKQELDNSFKVGEYDLKTEEASYQYCFVVLMGLDGSYSLTLIYTKWDGEEFVFDGISDIEVLGLANSNMEDPRYEGEKIMAQRYKMILQESENYMI